MITIHNFARGARGLRVCWQCEEMGLPYRSKVVAFPPPAKYLGLNPLGTVPFMQDDGGIAIGESVAMMLYLARRYGPTSLLPEDDPALLARTLQMTIFGETALGMAINPLLETHFVAPDADKRNWSVQALERRVGKALRYLIDLLDGGQYLVGNALTLADISVSTALGIWKGALGNQLPEALVEYRQNLAARPAYQRAVESQLPS